MDHIEIINPDESLIEFASVICAPPLNRAYLPNWVAQIANGTRDFALQVTVTRRIPRNEVFLKF
ncbi:MAG: hypothetical protein OXD01_01855 [Gammaproteobacteria bacterium]|nr:hypothetical protein [Gammaproteobacteria bacterium]